MPLPSKRHRHSTWRTAEHSLTTMRKRTYNTCPKCVKEMGYILCNKCERAYLPPTSKHEQTSCVACTEKKEIEYKIEKRIDKAFMKDPLITRKNLTKSLRNLRNALRRASNEELDADEWIKNTIRAKRPNKTTSHATAATVATVANFQQ